MSLDLKHLQRICDQVADEIDAIVSIFAAKGEIIASSRRDRIGDLHAGAAELMAGSLNLLEVTSEAAAADGVMLEGCIAPIEYDGQRLFCVGVAAPLKTARAYSRIVQHWVDALMRETELMVSEQRFRDVAESASDWIWEMDNNGRFTYLSPRFFEITRVPRESIIGRTRAEFAGAVALDKKWQEHEATLAARLPFRDFAYSSVTADGRLCHLKINGKPIYDTRGTFIGYRGTGCDITEKIEVEEALKKSRQLLFDAIETVSEGFSLYDKEDRLVMFNTKYPALVYPDGNVEITIGMTFESILRQAAESGLVQEARGRVEEWIQERMGRRRQRSGPHVQQRGENHWILVSEHRTADGGTVALYSDISELKQHERDLAKKSNALEQLSSQLAKYLSPQVYESIFTGRQEVKVASHRKKLTVFFSDIAGFTQTAERLESEDLTQLLNHYLTEMSRIALEYGATIDKYVGDAIVIFFGDPESLGVREDALACVRMAIAMRERMRDLQEIWRDLGIESPLKCRMGINTGFCTVGNFGSEDRMDYTIIGGGVNLASRLENAATPGDILISYETYALIKDVIKCDEHGKIQVKGFAYPIATYLVDNAFDLLGSKSTKIREDRPNFKLSLDLDSMTQTDRAQAAATLRAALDQVSGSV